MNKICRICMEEGVMSSIFTRNYNVSLCDMVEYCCNIKISRSDGLPEQMCSNCIYKLGIAYHFKQTCEGADLHLKQYLGLRIPDKTSEKAVMTDPMIFQTIIKKCNKCKPAQTKKIQSNYKKKPEEEKLKRGPKPKPKPIHQCYECHKEFRCQAQLQMHVRTHTGDKPFGCMFCSRRFTQKHNLTIHMRCHTGEKPFQCEMCSKTFSAQGNLQAHLKIHRGQKDHVCSLCNKSFITSSELTRHMSKHRGVRNFKCDLCDAAYIHARDLKLHKLKKHDVVPETQKLTKLNETYNNTTNIDIIGIDVDKDVTPRPVTSNHDVLQLVQKESEVLQATEHSRGLVPYDQKDVKDAYQEQPTEHSRISRGLVPYDQKDVKDSYQAQHTEHSGVSRGLVPYDQKDAKDAYQAQPTEHSGISRGLVPYDQKDVKDVYQEQPMEHSKISRGLVPYGQKDVKDSYQAQTTEHSRISRGLVPYDQKDVKNVYQAQPTSRISRGLVPYDQKDIKDSYQPRYINKVLEPQSCTICGEGFEYMTGLAEHYMNRHKDYQYNMKLYDTT